MKRALMEDKNCRKLFVLLVIAAVFANIKCILNDYDVDAGYAVAMGYRLAMGDKMFCEMWEPHQTSAFLCALLIKIFYDITNTVTGIVIYLNIMGIVIKGIFILFFYHTMKTLIKRDVLGLMCLFFFVVTPKWIPLPEFSNMLIWFTIGIFCSLVRFMNEQERTVWLILTGLFSCLAIVSYPSVVIVYVGVVGILVLYAKKKWIAVCIYSGVCLGFGAVYIGYFFTAIGYKKLLDGIKNIISSDDSHQNSLQEKICAYIVECGEIVFFLAILAGISFLIWGVVKKCLQNKKNLNLNDFWIVYGILLFICDVAQVISIDMDYDYRPPVYVVIIGLAVWLLKDCTEKEKLIVKIGLIISSLSFVAVLLLTNLDVMATINYLILAVMISFLPIINRIRLERDYLRMGLKYALILAFCGVTVFRSGYLAKAMNVQKLCVMDVRGIVKEGPAKGIVSEYMGPHRFNTTFEEWNQYIDAGDSVLIVSGGSCDSIQYLFEEVQISAASTISTPTYNERLIDYWKLNPDKYPDVVVVECWDGELKVGTDSWIMEWLQENYPECNFTDGKFWRYYQLHENEEIK